MSWLRGRLRPLQTEASRDKSPLAMSRRKWAIVVGSVIVVGVAAELAGRWWYTSSGCVEIVNQGDSALENLVVRYANTTVRRERLGVGQSTKVWFTSAERGLLSLDFHQKGNALKGFEVQDFDPADNLRNGFKLVLVVKPNRVERYMDDDPSVSTTTLADRIKEWVSADLKARP
jgi:hypothetical protein